MQAIWLAFLFRKPFDLLFASASRMTCLMTKHYAVLTGDLIGSTRASRAEIEVSLDLISALYGADHGFSRFRGDGWQIILDQPGKGLWAMIHICASLRASGGLESRVALGLGPVDHVDLADLSSASGAAFVHSGRTLSGLSKTARLGLAGEGVDVLHTRLVALLDDRMAQWSPEQATAAAIAMETFPLRTQVEIADTLGISRQAVAARLASAGFVQIIAAAGDFFKRFGDGRPWDA